jgi:hypothetical protein
VPASPHRGKKLSGELCERQMTLHHCAGVVPGSSSASCCDGACKVSSGQKDIRWAF